MSHEFSPDWLSLREPADAAARAAGLLNDLDLNGPLVISDLGCGTGSMGRWLAGRLPGPQHWILHDQDPELLKHAAATMAATAADGSAVTVETRQCDITRLTAADLAGTSLVTASALLDLLTAREITALATACAGRPALLTLSVTGSVTLDPADPLDTAFEAAFNAHQRRTVTGRTLLGPDAADAAAAAFRELGATVTLHPSPWRLGVGRAALTAEWLRGWVGAAVEERPDLPGDDYLRRRHATHGLTASVGHVDLLAR